MMGQEAMWADGTNFFVSTNMKKMNKEIAPSCKWGCPTEMEE